MINAAHGGNDLGLDIRLDLSANLNPMGMPESVRAAAVASAGSWESYPDPMCRVLREKLADVMDRDTDAFLMVSDAYALPKATDEEKAARSLAIQEGLKACTRTPLEMMELMGEAVELMASMMDGFNTNCASDLGVAALSLKAGILGAWLNVKINTGSLKDKAFAADAEARGQAVLDRAVPAAEDCFARLLKMVEA